MIGLIIIGCLLLLILGILFTPLFLYLNTNEQKYIIGLKGILTLGLIPDADQIIYFRISVIVYSFNIYPFKTRTKKKTDKVKKKKKKKLPGRKTIRLIINLAKNNIKSFKLKQLYLNIDTDNVITNAYLVPVFSVLHQKNIKLHVNNSGNVEMIVHIQNNIFHMLVVTISTYLKHKHII